MAELTDSNNFNYIGLYKSPPFSAYFWSAWYVDDLAKFHNLHTSFSGFISLEGGHCLTLKRTVETIKTDLETYISKKDFFYFNTLEQKARTEFATALTMAQQIQTESRGKEETLKRITLQARRFLFYWFYGWQLSQLYGPMLLRMAEQHGIKGSDVIGLIPRIETPLMQQQKDARALRMLLKESGTWDAVYQGSKIHSAPILEDPRLRTLFETHIRTYGWIQIMNWMGTPLSLEQLLQQIGHLNEEQPIGSTSAPVELAPYIQVAAQLGYLNQAGAEYSSIFASKVMPFLESLAREAEVSYLDLIQLLPNEIFENGTLSTTILQKSKRRMLGHWCVYPEESGQTYIIDDPESMKVFSDFIPKSQESDSSILRGRTGNKGTARGTVRVITAMGDFHKMQDGDVLVTPMTTPDFVLLMQRASAIVTDMGGLLCHAAIVSRELGKPCVIDTKIGTQVLKDGDLVEVNAETGVITKLS